MEYDENERTKLESSTKNSIRELRKKKKQNISNTIINPQIIILILLLIILIILFLNTIQKQKNLFNKKLKEYEIIYNMTLSNITKHFNQKIDILQIENENLKEKLRTIILTKNFKEEKLNTNGTEKAKIVAITYGSEWYEKAVEYNGKSAYELAKVDKWYGYTPKDIDADFKEKNEYILSNSRGAGYWLWKPYFILRTMKEKLNYGDYLIYSDAGILFVDKAQKIVDFIESKNVEMYLHRLPHLEKEYTKRDAFILMGADMPFYAETGQFNAAFQIYKKSKFTEHFLEEYLYYAKDKRIITDDQNVLGRENYAGFVDHRHDQSILSLLTKKYGQVNANKMNVDLNIVKNFEELMPTIFCHHRMGSMESYESLKEYCKNMNS